jgi:cytochrome c biogenesis protein CcmG/thiol:disulfide interchange protein DsbE
MKRILVALTLVALAACSGGGRAGTAQGDLAPAWSDPLSTGGTLSYASLQGKPVYLNFFATWCPPCNVETPWIEQFSKQYRRDGLSVIGIDMEENARAANGFRAKYQLTYPVVVDAGTLEALYDVNGLPVHVFIARNGTIYRKVVGEMSKSEIQSDLKAILATR